MYVHAHCPSGCTSRPSQSASSKRLSGLARSRGVFFCTMASVVPGTPRGAGQSALHCPRFGRLQSAIECTGSFASLKEWLQSDGAVPENWTGYQSIIDVLCANGCSRPEFTILIDYADIKWPDNHDVCAVGMGLLRRMLNLNTAPVTPKGARVGPISLRTRQQHRAVCNLRFAIVRFRLWRPTAARGCKARHRPGRRL